MGRTMNGSFSVHVKDGSSSHCRRFVGIPSDRVVLWLRDSNVFNWQNATNSPAGPGRRPITNRRSCNHTRQESYSCNQLHGPAARLGRFGKHMVTLPRTGCYVHGETTLSVRVSAFPKRAAASLQGRGPSPRNQPLHSSRKV